MMPVAILGFLIGMVLAWGFRVWILVPTTILVFLAKMIFDLTVGTNIVTTVGISLLVAMVPQLGYALGLAARSGLVSLRSPRGAGLPVPSKHRSIKWSLKSDA